MGLGVRGPAQVLLRLQHICESFFLIGPELIMTNLSYLCGCHITGYICVVKISQNIFFKRYAFLSLN